MKALNSKHLQVVKNLSVIKRCLLLRGSLETTVTFGTKYFVRYSGHVRYWEVALYFNSPQLAINKNKLYETLGYWSRDMLKFSFFSKGPGTSFSTTFSVWFFKANVFSCYILLTDQILLYDYLYLLRYWIICVLKLFVNQDMTS